MLQNFRRFSKAFLYIVIAAFVGTIIFAWGADITSSKAQKGIVGEVNGQEIMWQTYERAIDNYFRQISQSTQRELTQEEILEIRNRAWSELVTNTIYDQLIDRLGLTLTDVELAEHLKIWPPSIVQQYEEFQNEQGGFDYQKYLESMQDPRFSQFWLQVEAYQRYELRTMKLQELAWLGARVTGEDVKQEFIDNNELIKVEYAVLFRDQVNNPEILNDTSEVLEYYNAHKDRYFRPAEAHLKYIELSKVPTVNDSLGVYEQAKSIYDEIIDGADFAQLATDLSEDVSAQSGGDLGWFGEGMMVDPFEEAVFALADSGDVSEPVETEFGWHVIMKTGERETEGKKEIRASHILVKFKPSGQTISDLNNIAQMFYDLAQESGFAEAAKELQLEVQQSAGFVKGIYSGALGESPRTNDFAFSAQVGEISRIIEEPERFVIVQLDEVVPEGIPSFDKSYGRADVDLKQKKLSARVLAKAQEIHDLVASGGTMEDAAAQVGAEYHVSPMISRRDKTMKVGNDPNFLGTAFRLSLEEPLSKAIITSRGAAVVRLLERQAPNLELFTMEQDSLYQAMLGDFRQKEFQEWFAHLQEKNVVKDFRYEVFDMY